MKDNQPAIKTTGDALFTILFIFWGSVCCIVTGTALYLVRG
jgi:hypothetical protein